MKKEKTIKITVVVIIILSILGIFIYKGTQKSDIADLKGNDNTQDVNIYTEQKKLPTLMEFGSKTCEPCKIMEPILAKVKKDYKDRVIVNVIDVYKDSVNTRKYNIRTIPTQIFLDADGKVIYRHEGVLYEKDIVKKLTEMGVK